MIDSLTDEIWYFCPECAEEYLLPEETEKCPLCDSELEDL